MENIKYISNSLQLYHYHFADCKGDTLEHNGNEVCGVVTTFYRPDPVPFWFVCEPSGFRRETTKNEVMQIYKEYLKQYGHENK